MRAIAVIAVWAMGVSVWGQSVRSPSTVDGDQPIVAWVQGAADARAHVARWDEGRWVGLGGPLNEEADRPVSYVSLASGPAGLFAAWIEVPRPLPGSPNAHSDLYVAHWDGDRWSRLGPSLTRSENAVADLPQLREDAQGRPWVLWSEITADFNVENVYGARWTGGSWEVFDPGTLTTDVSSASRARDLRFDASNRPVLAWSRMPDFRTDYQVAVGVWDGTHWVPGPSANPDTRRYAGSPSMVFDQGRPLVAMLQAARGFDVWVERWTGDRWEPLGASLNGGSGGGQSPRIVLSARGPVVAWIENGGRSGLQVRNWQDGRWLPLGGDPSRPSASVLAVGLATVRGQPVLAWTESDPAGRLGVARWTGEAWEDLGSPSD